MALNNTRLRYYDSNVLRLPSDKRKEYHEQVDRLIVELCKSIRNSTEIKITKVVKAGSFAKYTILRKPASIQLMSMLCSTFPAAMQTRKPSIVSTTPSMTY